jgi:hypothetical protein
MRKATVEIVPYTTCHTPQSPPRIAGTCGDPAQDLCRSVQEYIRSAFTFNLYCPKPHYSAVKRPRQTPADRILWTLVINGGMLNRIRLQQKLNMKVAVMEPTLVALERKNKIMRIYFEDNGKIIQIISLA